MFGLYFGYYLVEKNKISQSQFEDLIAKLQKSRAKLGFIAVAEKLLTVKQAEEINDIQKRMDKRFGDVAVEKGYLLEEEVTYLLNMQGNTYLLFLQLLTESGYLTMEEIKVTLEDFQREYQLSDSELDALKSGDIDRIIPIFVDMDHLVYGEYASLAIRNVVRFINRNILLKKAYRITSYPFRALASQKLDGNPGLFVGLAGKDSALLSIAKPFAREEFQSLDEDAFDSVCEFLNCINGIYASKLSQEDIELEMAPPKYYTDKCITSEEDLYIVPFLINGEQADIIIAMNNRIGIN
jgi:hypothetical protein